MSRARKAMASFLLGNRPHCGSGLGGASPIEEEIMELAKSNARRIVLESYAIERSGGAPNVTVSAQFLVETPELAPSEMTIYVEYQYDRIPSHDEKELGLRLLEMIEHRVSDAKQSAD